MTTVFDWMLNKDAAGRAAIDANAQRLAQLTGSTPDAVKESAAGWQLDYLWNGVPRQPSGPARSKGLPELVKEMLGCPVDSGSHTKAAPGSLADLVQKEMSRVLGGSGMLTKMMYEVGGETSFEQLAQTQALAEEADRVRALSDAYPALARNILADPTITYKRGALETLAKEFSELVGAARRDVAEKAATRARAEAMLYR